MTEPKPSRPPRKRLSLGVDWLFVAAGMLALAVSVMSFLDSDAPVLAQDASKNSRTS